MKTPSQVSRFFRVRQFVYKTNLYNYIYIAVSILKDVAYVFFFHRFR